MEILINNGGNGRIGSMLTYPTGSSRTKTIFGYSSGRRERSIRRVVSGYLPIFAYLLPSLETPDIVLGDWWNSTKSDFDRQQAVAHGYAWIDLTILNKNPAMSGDGGPYHVDGVAKHPNDQGMKAIANAIDDQFDRTILPSAHKN